jgi:protein-disulfide isomerase
MFDRYRGLILTVIIISSFAYIGYRNEKNITNSVKIMLEESKTQSSPEPKAEELIALPKTSDQQEVKETISKTETPELTPSQVEEIVKSYLIRNPEVITEALDKLQQTRMDDLKKQVQKKIVEKSSELESDITPIIGNPNGSAKVVMFFDYNCGYCKQSYDTLQAVIQQNPNIKVYLKIYPILGNDSEFLAKIMTAIHIDEPSKFKAIHEELLSDRIFSKEDIAELFKEHGLNYSKYESLIESEEVTKRLKETVSLAKDLRINGVPTFIINGVYSPGFLSEEQINEKINSNSIMNEVKEPETKDQKENQQ